MGYAASNRKAVSQLTSDYSCEGLQFCGIGHSLIVEKEFKLNLGSCVLDLFTPAKCE